MSPALWVFAGCLCWAVASIGVGMMLGRWLAAQEAADVACLFGGDCPGCDHEVCGSYALVGEEGFVPLRAPFDQERS